MWGQTRRGEKPAATVSCTVVHHCQVTLMLFIYNLPQVEKFQAPEIFHDMINVSMYKRLNI